MIKGKKSFIDNVSRCLGRSTLPAAPDSLLLPADVHERFMKDASSEELKDIFVKNSEANGTLIFECVDTDIAVTIMKALSAFDSGSVVIGDHHYFREQGIIEALQEQLPDCFLWNTEKSCETNMEMAEKAMVGISMAEMGLAESGTVVLFSHKGAGRSVSLLPTYSITVVKACDLRPRLTQGMEFLQSLEDPLPSSINLISGASSTADIELVHVKGVHGPLKIAYVVVS